MLSVYAVEKSEIYGHGKRVVIWFSGCSLHCDGCINSYLWDKSVGTEYSVDQLLKLIIGFKDFNGVTYIGGEPLEQGEDLVLLSKKMIALNITFLKTKEVNAVFLKVSKKIMKEIL